MDPHAEEWERLTAYLDGELPADQRAEVEQWLADDTEARRLFDHLRQTSRMIADLPSGQAPDDLADVITTRLERQALLGETSRPDAANVPRGSWSRKLAIAASFALICTAAWLGWPVISDQNKSPEPILLAEKTGKELRSLPDDQIPVNENVALRRAGASPLKAKPEGEPGKAQRLLIMPKTDRIASKTSTPPLARRSEPFNQPPDRDGVDAKQKRLASVGYASKKRGVTANASKVRQQTTGGLFGVNPKGEHRSPAGHKSAPAKASDWIKPGSMSNQLEIVADEATIDRLVKLITRELAGHDIHHASMGEKSTLSTEEAAPFYAIQYPEAALSRPAAGAIPLGNKRANTKSIGVPPARNIDSKLAKVPREIHIVMSIRRNLAESLLSAMQRFTDAQESETIWSLNGRRVSADRPASAIQPHSEGARPERIASGRTSPATESADDHAKDSEEAAEEFDEEQRHIVSQDGSKEKQLISLVLTLRPRAATSDQALTTPTSHPTQEGSSGG